MPKILIEVRGGLVQNISSTSPDIEVFVFDYDNAKEDADDDEAGWAYWQSKGGDHIVTNTEFEDLIVNVNK